jgi:hypothetical protein
MTSTADILPIRKKIKSNNVFHYWMNNGITWKMREKKYAMVKNKEKIKNT